MLISGVDVFLLRFTSEDVVVCESSVHKRYMLQYNAHSLQYCNSLEHHLLVVHLLYVQDGHTNTRNICLRTEHFVGCIVFIVWHLRYMKFILG